MSAEDPTGPALLCWDGSASSRNAIQRAAKVLGNGHKATVLFTHIPAESARGLLGGWHGPDAPIMGITDAEDLLEQGIAVAKDAGFDASPLRVVAEQKTADVIVAIADEQDAPVIVMGQRGRSAVGVAMLGSVARGVVNSFHRPVMLVAPVDGVDHTAGPARPAG